MPDTLQTSHVREMAANLLLGRALQLLEAAGGMVVFQDAEGRWQSDRFALKRPADELDGLRPLLEAVLEWTLYTERPVAVADLRRSRWSQHLLAGRDLPDGAIAATPLAQRGAIWGAIVVFRDRPVDDALPLLGQLAELATEPLSSLGAGRPEGVA
ncbi:MAG TPA: GAF domain-containing protein [Candidatus Dormibacteraeota bacterium]